MGTIGGKGVDVGVLWVLGGKGWWWMDVRGFRGEKEHGKESEDEDEKFATS